MRAAEKKQYDRQNAYNRTHYDRVGAVLPKGTMDRIKKIAEKEGITVNALVKRIILDALDKEEEK